MLCRGAHDVFCDICHQQADDDQHHADGSPHRCHGDDNVLHPRWRQGKLHTVPLVCPLGWVGVYQRAEADAVGDVLMQLSQEKVPAARSKMDTSTLKLSITSVPPAAQLVASPSVAAATENSV